MAGQQLTVTEVIRYANHDFLNQLQLIQMNLELQRTDEAKKIISQFTEMCRSTSNMNQLNLPQTVEWLQTAKWRFTSFQMNITSHVDTSQSTKLDVELMEYLENTIIHVYDGLDPYTEQNVTIHIESTVEHFKLTFHLQGQFEMNPFNKAMKQLKVRTYEQTNTSWKYVLEHN